MDKLSTKVLQYLKKQSEPVSKDDLVAKFGSKAAESVRYLEKAEYIKSGSTQWQPCVLYLKRKV